MLCIDAAVPGGVASHAGSAFSRRMPLMVKRSQEMRNAGLQGFSWLHETITNIFTCVAPPPRKISYRFNKRAA
jgi:hypothetical protein